MGKLKYWNGSAFADGKPKIWDGSQFIDPSEAWIWDGSQFVRVWPQPVEFDSVGGPVAGPSSTKTWPHTIDGNCIVVVFNNTTSTGPVCTVGGVNIPRVFGPTAGGIVAFTAYNSVFALISNSLPQGPQTVSCTQGGSAASGVSMTFRNAVSLGAVRSTTAGGNVNEVFAPSLGSAVAGGYVAGNNLFGAFSPVETMRYGFISFNNWASLGGYGLDTGSGITVTSSFSGATKAGALVPIYPN